MSYQGNRRGNKNRYRGRSRKFEYHNTNYINYSPDDIPVLVESRYSRYSKSKTRKIFFLPDDDKEKTKRKPSRSPSPLEGSEEYSHQKIKRTSAILMRHLLNPEENILGLSNNLNEGNKRTTQSSSDIPNSNNTSTCENMSHRRSTRAKQPPKTSSSELNKPLNAETIVQQSPISINKKNRIEKETIHSELTRYLANLSHEGKKKFINSSSSAYNNAVNQFVKTQRLEISRALRNVCTNNINTSESSEFINSIIPEAGIKIENLPQEVLEELHNSFNKSENVEDYIISANDQEWPITQEITTIEISDDSSLSSNGNPEILDHQDNKSTNIMERHETKIKITENDLEDNNTDIENLSKNDEKEQFFLDPQSFTEDRPFTKTSESTLNSTETNVTENNVPNVNVMAENLAKSNFELMDTLEIGNGNNNSMENQNELQIRKDLYQQREDIDSNEEESCVNSTSYKKNDNVNMDADSLPVAIEMLLHQKFNQSATTLQSAIERMFVIDKCIETLTTYRQQMLNNIKLEEEKKVDTKTQAIQTETIQNKTVQKDIFKISDKISVLKVFEDKLLAATERGKIYFLNVDGNECSHILDVSNLPITTLSFSKTESGKPYLFVGSCDSSLAVYNFYSTSLLNTIQLNDSVQCLEENWGYVFFGCSKGTIGRFNIRKQQVEYQDNYDGKIIFVLKAIQEGPRKVLIIGSRNSPVVIRDAMNGLHLRTLDIMQSTIYSMIIHKNWVVCGTTISNILIFNFHDGKMEETLNASNGKCVSCMKMVGNCLFASCHNGNIYVFNMATKRLAGVMFGPGGVIIAMEVTSTHVIVGTLSFKFITLPIPVDILNEMALTKQ